MDNFRFHRRLTINASATVSIVNSCQVRKRRNTLFVSFDVFFLSEVVTKKRTFNVRGQKCRLMSAIRLTFVNCVIG